MDNFANSSSIQEQGNNVSKVILSHVDPNADLSKLTLPTVISRINLPLEKVNMSQDLLSNIGFGTVDPIVPQTDEIISLPSLSPDLASSSNFSNSPTDNSVNSPLDISVDSSPKIAQKISFFSKFFNKKPKVAPLVDNPSDLPPLVDNPSDLPPLVDNPADLPPLVDNPSDLPPLVDNPSDLPPLVDKTDNLTPIDPEQVLIDEIPVPEIPAPEIPTPEIPTAEIPTPEIPTPEIPTPEIPTTGIPAQEPDSKSNQIILIDEETHAQPSTSAHTSCQNELGECVFLPLAERIKNHKLADKYKAVDYANLNLHAKPFDLLLFRGNDIFSEAIMSSESIKNSPSEFSHCAMVINSSLFPHLKELDKKKLYLWEASCSWKIGNITDGVPDVEGKGILGIQIRDLETVLNNYVNDSDDKAIGWCRLKNNPWDIKHNEKIRDFRRRRASLIANMKLIHDTVATYGYDVNPMSCFGSIFPWLRPVRKNFDVVLIDGIEALFWSQKIAKSGDWEQLVRNIFSKGSFNDTENREKYTRLVFCSEMLVTIYQEIGVMDKSLDPASFCPTDFIADRLDVFDSPILVFPNENPHAQIMKLSNCQLIPDAITLVKEEINDFMA